MIAQGPADIRRWKQQTQGDDRESDITDAKLVVTYVFACAASVFLEVVVSGAYPQIPDVRHLYDFFRGLLTASAAADGIPVGGLLEKLQKIWQIRALGEDVYIGLKTTRVKDRGVLQYFIV